MDNIVTKLFEIQKMNLAIKKDGKNPHFKNEYITLDKLVSILQPICNEIWLLIVHSTKDNAVSTEIIDIENQNPQWEFNSRIYSFCSSFPLWDISNPQKVGSAITYAKRYNLCQIFNIITDRDDDGNKASVKQEKTQLPSFTKEDYDHVKSKLGDYRSKWISASVLIWKIEKTKKLSNQDILDIETLFMK